MVKAAEHRSAASRVSAPALSKPFATRDLRHAPAPSRQLFGMIVSTQRLRYGMVRPSICTGRSRAPRGQRRDEVRPARRARVVVRIQELTARFTRGCREKLLTISGSGTVVGASVVVCSLCGAV